MAGKISGSSIKNFIGRGWLMKNKTVNNAKKTEWRNFMENFNNSTMNLQTYGGNSLQAGYNSGYQEKLDYKFMEGKLDIEKRQVMQAMSFR